GLCQFYKKRYADAARFYTDALAAKPALPPGACALVRYDAARAAAQAAAGKGEDAPRLDKERIRLRQQALAWLRDALKTHDQQLAGADAKGRAAIAKTLQHWQQDADLASVRGEEALAKLPTAEREAWQQLWADVAALRTKASAGG